MYAGKCADVKTTFSSCSIYKQAGLGMKLGCIDAAVTGEQICAKKTVLLFLKIVCIM